MIFENKINIFGGEQYRPLLHVRDAAKAIVNSINIKETGIYNLSLQNYKIIDIARIVEKFFPSLEVNITEIPFQDARNYKVNIEKCVNKLNFIAKTTVEDGILEVKKF